MQTNSLKNILAISGSTRSGSVNHTLIGIISEMYTNRMNITQFDGIASLPHFNPDLDNEDPPPAVRAFRNQIRESDGVLICTPEYAMGVPGSLKNALDWLVSSMELSGKPVALITASSMGEKAHESVTGTLLVIQANLPESSRLLIPFVKSKIINNRIADDAIKEQVRSVMDSLLKSCS